MVDPEHLVPRRATVRGAKDAALVVRPVRVPEAGDEDHVGIRRMDDEPADLLHVRKPNVLPRLAAVDGFEDPVTDTEVGAMKTFARADVDDVRMRR